MFSNPPPNPSYQIFQVSIAFNIQYTFNHIISPPRYPPIESIAIFTRTPEDATRCYQSSAAAAAAAAASAHAVATFP